MQVGHARFVAQAFNFVVLAVRLLRGDGIDLDLVPPPVICQIPGICGSASVIVPSLPPYRMGLEEG
jgi:hypothetical protein